MIKEVLVDMDGVLVELRRTLMEMDGYDCPLTWESELKSRMRNPKDDFFFISMEKNVKHDCFYRAYPMPDFSIMKEMIHDLKNRGLQVSILSSVGTSKNMVDSIREQKTEWLKKHFGNIDEIFHKVHLVQGAKDKLNHANKSSILIDDYIKTYERFSANDLPVILHTSATETKSQLYKILGENK